MAKKTKKECSPEERLAAARVPKEEWPYELPEGWEWVRLGELTDIVGGGTPSSKVLEYYEGGEIPWLTPADLSNYQNQYISKGARNITHLGLEKSSARLLPEGTVCLSSRAPIGYVVIASNPLSTNQGFKSFLPSPWYLSEYLYWYLKGNTTLLESLASGTTFLELSAKRAAQIKMPLPPLETQKRIVDHIESLFAKLDQAKEKAQQALATSETRKAAILHQAFTGQLTAHWREKNGVGMETWKTVKLQDVCEKIVCGKTPTEFISPEGEIPFLKVYNIVDNTLDFESKPQFIPREVHEGKLKSSILKPHDVIMNIVGPPLRKIAIIPDTYSEWNMNQAIVRFRPQKELNYQFLYYALIYPKTLDDVILETKGVVGQANISLTQSRNLIIKLPTDSEQVKIVELIKNLYLKIEKEQDYIKKVLLRIERIRESILHQAFVGRLTRKGV